MASIYDFSVKDIDHQEISLEKFKGKTLLIVNVASRCGFTPQYTGLQNLYEKYDTIKKRSPREIILIKIKIKILNPISPLAIVKTLYGKGVKPAKKRIPSQA